MAIRRGLRRTPYPAAAVITALATTDQNWPLFDGWCASRNVEPLRLPWQRFLNLVYFWATQGKDKKELREFDSEINKAVSRWNMEILRKPKLQLKPAPAAAPVDVKSPNRGKLPPPPTWWGGDDQSKQSMLVIRQLNSINVGKPSKTR